MNKQTFEISPIGKIEQTREGFQLKIEEAYKPALKELEKFGHVMVLWWCNMADTKEYRQILECRKPYKTAPAKWASLQPVHQ